MVLDLLTLTTIPTAVGAAEAVHQQRVLNKDAESEERRAPFHLHVYCDAQSKKRDEVHDTIVVLRDGKVRLWPKDSKTNKPAADPDHGPEPHPFSGFYLPFPSEDLPHRPIPAPPILGLVSTIPSTSSAPSSSTSRLKGVKPKLNWLYVDKETREVKYGPRVEAREHIIGSWDWTEDEEGLTLDDEESFVAVEEDKGGYAWAVYWDKDDNRLKDFEVGQKKRVLRCSLERRLVHDDNRPDVE